MELKELKAVKWAIYALLGDISEAELLTNRNLLAAFERLDALLKGL